MIATVFLIASLTAQTAPPEPPRGDDEDRVEENTPPPPSNRWPPKATERLEEDPEAEADPEAQLEADRRYARYSLIAGDTLVAGTYALAFALGVDGSAAFKLSLGFGSFAALLGPGVLVALNQTDRSMAEVWLDWFAWLGGGLSAAAIYVGHPGTFFEVATSMALAGLACHLALVLSPDREGVHGLELLLMGAGFTLATVLFALTASGLGNNDPAADWTPRLLMIAPGLVLAATRIGFAASHAWGWKPSVGPVDRLSFFAAPRAGGLTAGVGLVF